MRKQVKDYPNLEKDTHSKAIVSSDRSGYRAALKRREHRKQQNDKIQQLENSVAELQSLVKSLLHNK